MPFELLSDKSKMHYVVVILLHPDQRTNLSNYCFLSSFFSPCLRHQVCVNRKGLPSYEREKCSETKQGAFLSFLSCLLLTAAAVVVAEFVRFFQEVLELAFSVLYDPDETLNFVAPNKYEVSRYF